MQDRFAKARKELLRALGITKAPADWAPHTDALVTLVHTERQWTGAILSYVRHGALIPQQVRHECYMLTRNPEYFVGIVGELTCLPS